MSDVEQYTLAVVYNNQPPNSSGELRLLHLSSDGEFSDTTPPESLVINNGGFGNMAISRDGRFGVIPVRFSSVSERSARTFQISEGPSISEIDEAVIPIDSIFPDEIELLPNLDSFLYGRPFTRARLSPTGHITGEFSQVLTTITDHYIAAAPDSLSALVNHTNTPEGSRLTVFGLPPGGGIVDPGPALYGPQLAALDTIPPRLPDGDCNGDRGLNVGDIITLVNHFDNSTTITVPGHFAAADLDEDLVLEPSDFSGVQNLLLGLPAPQLAPAANSTLKTQDSKLSAPDGAWLTPEEFSAIRR